MDLPEALPRALAEPVQPEIDRSPALSLTARPGDGSIRTRNIAVLVAPGVDGEAVAAIQEALVAKGAICRLVGPRIGAIKTADGEAVQADASMENAPAFLFDALVLPSGKAAVTALSQHPFTMAFVKDQYLHGKPLLALGQAQALIDAAGPPSRKCPNGETDPGPHREFGCGCGR